MLELLLHTIHRYIVFIFSKKVMYIGNRPLALTKSWCCYRRHNVNFCGVLPSHIPSHLQSHVPSHVPSQEPRQCTYTYIYIYGLQTDHCSPSLELLKHPSLASTAVSIPGGVCRYVQNKTDQPVPNFFKRKKRLRASTH